MNISRWLGWLLLLLGLLGTASAQPTNAIIFIQHERAGPYLPSFEFPHAHGVRWPKPVRLNDTGPWWAFLTGVEWASREKDALFRPRGSHEWLAMGQPALLRAGVLAARAGKVGTDHEFVVVENSKQASSKQVMMLGVPGHTDILQTLPWTSPIPPRDALVLHDALSWEEVEQLSQRIPGRTLVISYPPDPNTRWSRIWFKGNGWSKYTRDLQGQETVARHRSSIVPGLIEARWVTDLLYAPEYFKWEPDQTGVFGGANVWLKRGIHVDPGLRILFLWLLALGLTVAFYLALNEDKSPFASRWIGAMALTPAGFVIGGNLGYLGWIEHPYLQALVGLALASALFGAIELVRQKRMEGCHHGWSIATAGWVSMLLLNPTWSSIGGPFWDRPTPASGEALGAFAAYTIGAICLCRTAEGQGLAISRSIALLTLIAAPLGSTWWWNHDPAWLSIPVVGSLIAERAWMKSHWIVMAILPPVSIQLVHYGVRSTPFGLYDLNQQHQLDLSGHAAFMLSGALWGTILLGAAFLLFHDRYLTYRANRMLRHDPRRKVLFAAAGAIAGLGLVRPVALEACLIVIFFGTILLFQDLLREAY